MRRYCSAAIVAVVAILVSIAVLAILASIAVVAPASAQTYPDKPIKFIVPLAAGAPRTRLRACSASRSARPRAGRS